jgi:hypothetical protein
MAVDGDPASENLLIAPVFRGRRDAEKRKNVHDHGFGVCVWERKNVINIWVVTERETFISAAAVMVPPLALLVC